MNKQIKRRLVLNKETLRRVSGGSDGTHVTVSCNGTCNYSCNYSDCGCNTEFTKCNDETHCCTNLVQVLAATRFTYWR